MEIIIRSAYILLLSYNPWDVFTYYNVEEMHGLSLAECSMHHNTPDSSYIAGWCNYVTQEDGVYEKGDPKFVYINLTRCTTDIETFGLIMHELMHQSFDMHSDEEDIITWAEEEAYQVFKIVKHELNKSE